MELSDLDTQFELILYSEHTPEEVEAFADKLMKPIEKFIVILTKVSVYFDQVCDQDLYIKTVLMTALSKTSFCERLILSKKLVRINCEGHGNPVLELMLFT